MSVYTAIRPPGGQSALVAAASDGRHRPASHPVLKGLPRFVVPEPWPMGGSQIRARRRARGWSQYRLAEVMGVSRPAVAQWESGNAWPSSQHQARLREVLR